MRWFVSSACVLSFLLTATGRAIPADNGSDEIPTVTFDSFKYSGIDPTAQNSDGATYANPILAGFYPDPSMCRVGQDYYLINSTFAYFPGIPIFHSTDLVNWHQLGHVIDRPGQLEYDGIGVSEGIFAPAITHHAGTFYVVSTMVGGDGNFIVTATDPAGPWSDATPLHFEGIDPSLFFDDDGRAWIVNNGAPEGTPLYEGHRAIWLQEFDPVQKKMIGPRKVLVNGGVEISTKPIWIEGPHLFKRNGWYYLSCAEGGTGPGHSQVVFRSHDVEGPYEPWDKNPILTQRDLNPNESGAVTCTGHADLEIGPDGQWWAVFLGVRPYDGQYSPMGRETFLLPVTWTDDEWPTILPPTKRVPIVGKSPTGADTNPSETSKLSGTFTWQDNFDNDSLSPEWITLRAPHETWWKLNSTARTLELTPRADKLSGSGNPSFLARRVQHAKFTASLVVEPPKQTDISAGLAVFQNERHHYFLATRREGDTLQIALEQTRGRRTDVLKSASLAVADAVELRIDADEDKCSFAYGVAGGVLKNLVKDADATMLTTRVAGGFVGATVGPLVRRNEPAAVAGPVDSGPSSSIIGPLSWISSSALIKPTSDETHELVSVKDPTVVHHNDMWHLYATTANSRGNWSMVYLSFKDWPRQQMPSRITSTLIRT